MASPHEPLLLFDINGVFALESPRHREGLTKHEAVDSGGVTHVFWLDPQHRPWLQELADSFQLVWATRWQYDAPRLFEPLLECPPMDVIFFGEHVRVGTPIDKIPAIAAYVGDRPMAWVDDELSRGEKTWASGRAAPTLLVETDPSIGLTKDQVNELLQYADGLD
jgi:hypothetical protein